MGMYDRQHEWLSTQAADLAGYVLELLIPLLAKQADS